MLAMHGVVNGTGEYNIRYIFRWYSKEFHTPLHVVETIPMEDILQNYFECNYERMSEFERKLEIERLLMSDEELQAQKIKEDAEDADTFEFTKMSIPNNVQDLEVTAEKLGNKIRDSMADPVQNDKIPHIIEPLPENISINFEDPTTEDLSGFGPPKTPKIK